MYLVSALLMTLALDGGLAWLGDQRPRVVPGKLSLWGAGDQGLWAIDRPGMFSLWGPGANPRSKKERISASPSWMDGELGWLGQKERWSISERQGGNIFRSARTFWITFVS